ncbi:hypothetical protein D3C85_1045220 [compost metagenome]
MQEVGEHQTHAVDRIVDDKPGRPHHQHRQGTEQRPPADHAGQALHAAFQADVRAEREDAGDQQDDTSLHGEAVFQAREVGQTVGESQRGDHHGHGEAAEGADQKQDIHQPPDRAVGLEAGNRLDDAGQAQFVVLAHVVVVGHGHAPYRIAGPGAEAPVKERVGDAHVQGLGRLGGDVQARRVVVVGPFHQPPIEGGGTQARADEHEDPGNGLELGLARTQADVAVLAEDDEQRTDDERQENHQHRGRQQAGGGQE